MLPPDTIAAIATAPGQAAIAIVRLSGPSSLAIADNLFSGAGQKPSHFAANRFAHGWIRSQNQSLDEVILLVMRAPQSYTREDVVEIQCHGGSVSARRILRAVLDAGARLAAPGEFTQRAFLNGRIDLVQAEAVMDLVRARSERAATAAIEQLDGRLTACITSVYDILLNVCVELEATLDFEQDELPPATLAAFSRQLETVCTTIQSLMATRDEGHWLREGALAVISGRPNAGKSTLFNLLLGRARAIVSPVAGTTRDTLEETLILEGMPIRLVDTAGLCESQSEIETEGVRRARQQMARADVHLHVIDASQLERSDDYEFLQQLDPRKTIVIYNKIDLLATAQDNQYKNAQSIQASLINKSGVAEIKSYIIDMLGVTHLTAPHAVIAERHWHILSIATADIQIAKTIISTERHDLIVPAISHLRYALTNLDMLTGKQCSNDILQHIFSRFCIGK